MRARFLGLLAPLVLLSCDNPLELSDCPNQVEITVSGGTTPMIDWMPRCHLSRVLVSEPGDYNVWGLHSPPQFIICSDDGGGCTVGLNTLYPPLRYGAVPRNAYQDLPPGGEQPSALVAGYPYTFRLYRANTDPMLLAVDTFTITP